MRGLLALAVFVLLASPARAEVIETGDPGRLETLVVPTAEGPVTALLYSPSTLDGRAPAPLLVVSHGCNVDPFEQMRTTDFHPVAERHRFYVLYTDVPLGTHPGRCWRWTDPLSQQRGLGDPAILVAQVRAATTRRNVDPQRVYALGLSSGGMMTSIVGAAYPDLFAAIAIASGGPYRTYACEARFFSGYPEFETPILAYGAYEAMGPRARVVPALVLHGDADEIIHPSCGVQAAEQWVRTNNLVASKGVTQRAPLALEPTAVRTVAEPGRRVATVRDWRDAAGCLVVQRWEIAGMMHRWSGGPGDPGLANLTDPTGPTASRATWAFLSSYTRDGPRCTPSLLTCTVQVAVPARIKQAVRVRVAGRRVPVRRRAVRVAAGARVVVTGRTARGKRLRRVLTAPGC